jgi:hypothetical protein
MTVTTIYSALKPAGNFTGPITTTLYVASANGSGGYSAPAATPLVVAFTDILGVPMYASATFAPLNLNAGDLVAVQVNLTEPQDLIRLQNGEMTNVASSVY